ncbi:MAG: hypothetical protein JW874_02145 [Spirochaetales bacterium]|nr:hypothetical protein [Spirochaetales bacterium]
MPVTDFRDAHEEQYAIKYEKLHAKPDFIRQERFIFINETGNQENGYGIYRQNDGFDSRRSPGNRRLKAGIGRI